MLCAHLLFYLLSHNYLVMKIPNNFLEMINHKRNRRGFLLRLIYMKKYAHQAQPKLENIQSKNDHTKMQLNYRNRAILPI